MTKQRFLLVFTILFFNLCPFSPLLSMENQNNLLNLNNNFEEVIEVQIKNYTKYEDYQQINRYLNHCKKISKNIENDINNSIEAIKTRLNSAQFKDLNSDYKLAIFLMQLDNVDAYFINFYLDAQKNVNMLKNGFSALMYAALVGHKIMLEILIKLNANINTIGLHGLNALILATSQNQTEIVQILLNNKADTNLANSNKETPLMYAISNGNQDIVKLLIKYNALVNLENIDNKTALFFAIKNDRQDIIKLLGKSGASTNLKTQAYISQKPKVNLTSFM